MIRTPELQRLIDEGFIADTPNSYIIMKCITFTEPVTFDKSLVIQSQENVKN